MNLKPDIGMLAVTVVCPSLQMTLDRPLVAMSDRVLFAHVEEIVVPVTTGFPEARLKDPEPLNDILWYLYPMSWLLALVLKPLVFLFFFLCIIFPLKFLAMKLLPDGKLKRLLFIRLN